MIELPSSTRQRHDSVILSNCLGGSDIYPMQELEIGNRYRKKTPSNTHRRGQVVGLVCAH